MNRLLLALCAVLLLTACGNGDDNDSTPQSSPAAATPVSTEPSATATTPALSATSTSEPEATATLASTATATTEPTPTVDPSPTSAPETPTEAALAEPVMNEFLLPAGSRPHDVAPAEDGTVWYTAQGSGELGRLDPQSGETRHIPLGSGSAPHGVIVGPDDAPWITDGGLNAIVRVDPETEQVVRYPLPDGFEGANLNTATFDGNGILWFTGQAGVYGRLDPESGEVTAWDAPEGQGPYGITTTPAGDVYYASLAGSHIARIDTETGEATVIEPPTPDQGARRVWSDSQGRIWVSEWNSGQVSVYNPADESWQAWRLPGDNPQPYAVYVDERDIVWLSDFGANTLVSFDPETETFESYDLPGMPANVRQILGRPGEIWGAESAVNRLVVLRLP